ncbi:DUF4190 domain-containing protein [Lipingzhangella sp. LS1_29]|uniref:DUF4190 domain-containing protein n=1 Tax=Lipingzhangella rawalii TaxID=2055835 RepID=A0ABU2H312_9ACTN|nr:DUF4190 domain-containing protein [Lipingzhangella rawalii]MDS1269195.1 DUF4190 domain-containing protein [Lipingzhangella rawalii]
MPPGPSGAAPSSASQGNAIAALIANVVGLLMCCLTSLPGLVLAIIALVQTRSNPQASRVCAIIAWVLFGLSVLTMLLLVVTGFWAEFMDEFWIAYDEELETLE